MTLVEKMVVIMRREWFKNSVRTWEKIARQLITELGLVQKVPVSYEELMTLEEQIAKKLYYWLHSTSPSAWESKKTPEVVRVAHRKRAKELITDLKADTTGIGF